MEVTSVLAFKVFVSVTAIAGLIDMYVVQVLKECSDKFSPGIFDWPGRFSSETFVAGNLRWASALPPVRYIIGDATIAFMKTRTLLFPIFELVFGTLVTVSLYRHGLGSNFIRTVIFLALALPLGMISLHSPGAFAPKIITYPGIIIGLLTSLIPGSIGLANSILGAVTCSVFLIIPIFIYGPYHSGIGCVFVAMMIGAFCGFRVTAYWANMFGFGLAALVGVVGIALGRMSRKSPLPLASFQAVGGVIAMIWFT